MGFLAETAELAVRISLKDNASAGIRGLQKNLGSLSGSIGRVGKGAGQIGAGFARAGLVVGGAVVTGLTAATKATIDFQDAFAGVRKTVEGTPAELDEMYGSLRQLATRIPVKFTDLAGIAQEAGALGVARDDVVGFTDVVARLSAATVGLSTDAAAEAFGKLGNVLFTTQEKADGLIDEYNRMGSALVALGNAGASSEGDIIEVAKRFGAAGHAAGLSAAEILGVSSALASLGIEPEAAGGALSRLFNNLTTNLALGNKKAVAFGKTIGLTAAGAKKAFGKDALGTFETFLQKLAGLDKFKQAEVLKAAGITNTRDINAIRLMSQQYAELQRQVDLSTKAYEENTELQKISAQRFDTLKNKLIVLKNLFFDAAVTVGEGFTPALGRAADKLGAFLRDPDNQQSLKDLGKDIGDTIDNIDWAKVRDGAKTFVSVMKGALDVALAILQALDKLPDSVKAAGLGFLALNKLSGGLIGQGAGNIVGGLAGAAATGLGSRLPGVGKLFAQPVYVTNWPGGFGGGGGLSGAGAGAAGLGVVGTAAAATGIAGAAITAGHDTAVMAGAVADGYRAYEQKDVRGLIAANREIISGVWAIPGPLRDIFTAELDAKAALLKPLTVIDKSPDARDARNKQSQKLQSMDTRLEAVRAVAERTTAAVNTARINQIAAIRTGDASIVAALRNLPAPIVKLSVTSNTFIRAAQVSGTYTAAHVGAYNKAGSLI